MPKRLGSQGRRAEVGWGDGCHKSSIPAISRKTLGGHRPSILLFPELSSDLVLCEDRWLGYQAVTGQQGSPRTLVHTKPLCLRLGQISTLKRGQQVPRETMKTSESLASTLQMKTQWTCARGSKRSTWEWKSQVKF